jgi:Cu-processing system permease protein
VSGSCTWIIARLTFKEAVRRKIVVGALLLGIVFLAVYGAGSYYMHGEVLRMGSRMAPVARSQIYNFLLLAGLYVVNFMFAAITVLVSADTIAGEIASGTIHAVATKPVRRWEILAGKWLGFAAMLTIYLAMMAGGVVLLARLTTGYQASNVPRALALIWLNGILLLNVSLLGGTLLSPLANGVMVFAAYGVAFIGGWVEQIGSLLQSAAAVNVGIVSSLLMPTEALWRRAAYEMRSLLVSAVGMSPFVSTSSVPSPVMIGYGVCYAAAALALAVWAFSRRDL